MAAPTNGIDDNPFSAKFAAAVTPHDSTNLAAATRGLYVGTAGDVSAAMLGDSASVTFASVPAGTTLAVRAIRVNSTGTTASNIVALW